VFHFSQNGTNSREIQKPRVKIILQSLRQYTIFSVDHLSILILKLNYLTSTAQHRHIVTNPRTIILVESWPPSSGGGHTESAPRKVLQNACPNFAISIQTVLANFYPKFGVCLRRTQLLCKFKDHFFDLCRMNGVGITFSTCHCTDIVGWDRNVNVGKICRQKQLLTCQKDVCRKLG
jgi:hypothetical protein